MYSKLLERIAISLICVLYHVMFSFKLSLLISNIFFLSERKAADETKQASQDATAGGQVCHPLGLQQWQHSHSDQGRGALPVWQGLPEHRHRYW